MTMHDEETTPWRASTGPGPAGAPAMRIPLRTVRAWATVGLVCAAAVGAGWFAHSSRSTSPPRPAARHGLIGDLAAGADTAAKSDARAIATEMEIFYTDHAAYPSSADVAALGNMLTVGSDALRISAGETVLIKTALGGGAYCVQVTNPAGSDPLNGVVYRSDTGGIQSAGSNCQAYPVQIH